MENPMMIKLIGGVICTAIGMYIAYYEIVKKKVFRKNGIPVVAKIHEIDHRRIQRKHYALDAYVLFHTENNEEIITKLDVSSFTMKVGQKINIIYQKDDPYKVKANVKIASVFNYIYTFIFTGAGFTLITIAIKNLLQNS
jgi:hypothetical protein